MIDSFDQRKRNVLESLESPCGDKSRKGSVDAPIASLCRKINSQRDIYTTSSCSGRISVFAEPDSLSRSQGKKGGEWVFASHDRALEQEVLSKIIERKSAGSLVLRFEPFILHAECRTLEEASKVLLSARNAGYRESGATLGGRVMIAIRCSLRLEVPVADRGDLLVPESYLCYLIRLANEKFSENEGRVKKLEAQLDLIWDHPAARPSRPLCPSQAAISQTAQVTKGFRPFNDLDTIPGRPRKASEVMVDPRKILLGRQLSILKRIKAMEKTVISESPLSGNDKSAHDQLPLIHQVTNESAESSSDMKWEELALTSESSLTVSRWGHASVLLPSGVICIIGGYGGHGVTHTRMADVMTISLSQGGAKILEGHVSLEGNVSTVKTSASHEGQGVMAARQGHTATLMDKLRVLVVGGRSSPAEAFDDVWLLDTRKWSWTKMKIIINHTSGEGANRGPSRRYRHSAVAVKIEGGLSGVLVFGGRDGSGTLLGDLWFIQMAQDDPESLRCTLIPPSSLAPSSGWPSPRKSHATVAISKGEEGHVYLYGGAGSYGEHYDDLYCLDVSQLSSFLAGGTSGVSWRRIEARGSAPPSCFSHTLTLSHEHHKFFLVGGHPGGHHSSLFIFDLNQETWEKKDLPERLTDFVPIRHSTHSVGGRLVIIGGGAFCFSFGTIFSSVWTLQLKAGSKELSSVTVSQVRARLLSYEDFSQGSWAFEVPLSYAKEVKDALKACGWLDKLVKVEALEGFIILPLISSQAAQSIALRDASCVPCTILDALNGGARLIKGRQMQANSKANHQDPKAVMRASMTLALKSLKERCGHFISESLLAKLLDNLPTKWEKLGDLALIPASSMSCPDWEILFEDMGKVWLIIARAIGVQRLARQQPIAKTGTRDSTAKMLLGSDGWVAHKEGRVTYHLDVTKCMFSSGNCSERIRMGRLASGGQVVVDLFCGIGYFTLSFLINGGAKKVFACDWNPNAITALKKNLAANNISADRFEVMTGDCRLVAPKGVADRVSLGLIPSSRIGWVAAVASLKPASGGWLHVHYNVKDSEVDSWSKDTAVELEVIALALGREGWKARIDHVEKVKSYAPHIIHIVVDIFLGPMPSPLPPALPLATPVTAAKSTISFESLPPIEVVEATGKDRDWFDQAISRARKPVILSGLDLGTCVEKWSADYLGSLASSQSTMVSVHVTEDEEGALDFVRKNFSFHTMTLSELMKHVSASTPSVGNRRYYLRSIGANPRKEPANLSESFPDLASDVTLPLHLLPHDSVFSTVLRISSPSIRLWTHYDVMDNFLLQVAGRKKVLLWPPSDHENLYIEGSSSPIIRIHDPSVLSSYPKFAFASTPIAGELAPGDVLFIPSLWFHNVSSADDGPTISINSFFRHLPDCHYEKKDLYGNRDLVEANEADAAIDKAMEALGVLPEHYRNFYLSRALQRMQKWS